MRRLVANNLAASLASVDYYISALCIRLCLDGAENAAAGILPIARVYINVERGEAKGAMVS